MLFGILKKILSQILWKEKKQESWKIGLLGGRYAGKSSLVHQVSELQVGVYLIGNWMMIVSVLGG